MKIRVRYAPSPTGYLHIGGARTALFNFLFAKHNNGSFIVRIEDTDLERNIKQGVKSQLDNLRWLGIIPDETIDLPDSKYGPYKQTDRLSIYLKYAEDLVSSKKAYYCFCSPEEIENMREKQKKNGFQNFKYDRRCFFLADQEKKAKLSQPKTIRVLVPQNESYIIEDLVRGKVVFKSEDIGDYVLIKSNNIPTYNFAVAIDDHLMEISHVFRGEEHLSNTPKQILIYNCFQWKIPAFGHMTLIINEQKKKLSKRDNSVMQFIEQYKEKGFLPEAIFNFLALLGWSSHEEKEIYTKQELIKIFNYHYLSKAPSMFDEKKIIWMNNFYIKKLNFSDYKKWIMPFVERKYDLKIRSDDWWNLLISIYQKQLNYGEQITDLISLFFNEENISEVNQKYLSDNDNIIKCFKNGIEQISYWSEQEISKVLKNVENTTKIKGKNLYMPIRIKISSREEGPSLVSTIYLFGKDSIMKKLT